VVNAIEGPIELAHCYRGDETDCQQLKKCSVRKPIRRIQDSIARLLDSITIEEITRLP